MYSFLNMHIPQEVLNCIASHLLTPSLYAPEDENSNIVWDTFIDCDKLSLPWHGTLNDSGGYTIAWPAEDEEDDEKSTGARRLETSFYELTPDVPSLLAFRLVSRPWHAAAMRLLAKHPRPIWTIRLDRASLRRALRCFDPDLAPKTVGTLRGPVWRVEVPPVTDDTWLPFTRRFDEEMYDDDFEVDSSHLYGVAITEDRIERRYGYDDVLRPVAACFRNDRSAENNLLMQLFEAMAPLVAFGLCFPEAGTPGRTPFVEGYETADCYDMPALNRVIASVAHGLGQPAFSHLTSLKLELPSPRYIEPLAKAMQQETRDKLQHLFLRIVDSTGSAGRYENIPQAFVDDSYIYDGTTSHNPNCPRSNVQAEYPNCAFQKALWELASSCPNLESLGVLATHFLDLDRMDRRPPPTSRGLRVLALGRVWGSVPSIVKLLRPGASADGPPLAKRVWLRDVKIRPGGGDWASLFGFLLDECPGLELAGFRELNYFSEHAKYVPHHVPLYKPVERTIWTADERDEAGLGELCRMLVRKAGGGLFIPRGLFRMI